MKIDLDDELTLPRFRKIVKMLPNSNVIKVCVNGQLCDITNIIDKKNVTILEVSDDD